MEKKKVICGLSGGVDSSVVAALLSNIIGKRLICIFVNHGFLRKEEEKEVKNNFNKYMNSKLVYVNASKIFYLKLKNISDPEKEEKNYRKKNLSKFLKKRQRKLKMQNF